MRNKGNKHLGLEIDKELHYKLHYISKYEGRSANGQILFLSEKPLGNLRKRTARSKYRRKRNNNISCVCPVG